MPSKTMSRNTKNFNKKTVIIPNCNYCKNLGLKFDHWTRSNSSPDSVVTCPVLLKTECRYCHQLGHNISKCSRFALSKNTNKNNGIINTDTPHTTHLSITEPITNTSYASIAKKLLDVLHKPKKCVALIHQPHGRFHDWNDFYTSDDD